jgi:hypothetical protein
MINNKDKIDDLFKKSLEGYGMEPSKGKWKDLERAFFRTSPGMKKGIAILALLLVATGGILTWRLMPIGNPPGGTGVSPHPSPVISSGPGSSVPSVPGRGNTGRVVLPEASEPASDPAGYQSPSAVLARENADGMTPVRPLQAASIGFGRGIPVLSGGVRSLPPAFIPDLENQYVRKAEKTIGVNFFPAGVFYPQSPTRNAWQGELTFGMGGWHGLSFHTGIGVSHIEDMTEYRLRYASYDSIGYFMNVTSFEIDPGDPSRIILSLMPETVYDSVAHEDHVQEPNRYTYLYFPLDVSWKALGYRKLSLSVLAGAKVAWLVDSREADPEYAISGVESIAVQDVTPGRKTISWMMTVGLALHYRASDRIGLNLEPAFEYYLQGPYQGNAMQGGSKRPYLVGVKAGIFYQF